MKRVFIAFAFSIVVLFVCNIGCLSKKNKVVVKKKHNEVALDSFYNIISLFCQKTAILGTINNNKSYIREYIMIRNTIFEYGYLLIRNEKDTNFLNCIESDTASVNKIQYEYYRFLSGQSKYFEELNIYIPAGGDENSYYEINGLIPKKD